MEYRSLGIVGQLQKQYYTGNSRQAQPSPNRKDVFTNHSYIRTSTTYTGGKKLWNCTRQNINKRKRSVFRSYYGASCPREFARAFAKIPLAC